MGAVRIERLRCRYRVPSTEPAPAELALRLDRVARDRVPRACAEMLAAAVPADDPGIVLIRRLDVRLLLRHGLLDEIPTAALWSKGITVAISRAVAGEPDGERVVRFDDRAHQLSQFVEDVVAGTAWARWYHAPFARLRGLAANVAVRDALLAGSALIPAVLGRLVRAGRLDWVTATLAEDDARALVDAVEAAGDGGVDGLEHILAREGLRAFGGREEPGFAALHLLARLAAAGVAPAPGALAAVRDLAELRPLLDDLAPPGFRGRESHLIALARSRGGAPDAAARRLSSRHPALLDKLLAAGGRTGGATDATADGRDVVATPYGGAFLLLPALAELELRERLIEAGLPRDESGWALGIARWLVLIECLGPQARGSARHDAAIALAAGLERPPGAASLRSLGHATAPDVAAGLAAVALERFVRTLRGFEAGSPAYVARNFLIGSSLVRGGEDGVTVSLPRVPLQIVLRMAGWAGGRFTVPWLPGGLLSIVEDRE